MTIRSDPTVLKRRGFLKWMSGIGAVVVATFAGVPAVAAFVSPLLRTRAKKSWLRIVSDTATLDVGIPVKIDFVEEVSDAWVDSRAQRSVWVYSEDGVTFTAFSNVCTHLGCGYGYDGEKKRYHCPCHHGLFDTKTGAVLGGPPPRPLDTLAVKVEKGDLFIQYQTFRPGIAAKVES